MLLINNYITKKKIMFNGNMRGTNIHINGIKKDVSKQKRANFTSNANAIRSKLGIMHVKEIII